MFSRRSFCLLKLKFERTVDFNELVYEIYIIKYTWLPTPRYYKLVTITIKPGAASYMYMLIFWYQRPSNAFSLIDREHMYVLR